MTHHEHDTCHKCGGVGIFLESQEVGYNLHGNNMWVYDYECEDCHATWDVSFELTPVSRENHES